MKQLAHLAVCTLMTAAVFASECSKTSSGLTPLNDPFYFSPDPLREGGLYPGRSNVRPAAHEAAGLAQAALVVPRDAGGSPNAASGRIVFLSIGMSNTTQEFTAFRQLAAADSDRDPRVTVVDGAQGGWTAAGILANPDTYFNVITQRLTAAGATAAQVQAAWVKEADASPSNGFPAYARQLQTELASLARMLRVRYPNLRLAYLSSRIYGGYASSNLNPEPYAYESGFSVKWVIADQIQGNPELSYASGTSPWLAWGPYLWADGLTMREDGLTWACAEFEQDGTHPGPAAEQKVGRMLLDFLHSDTTARLWYLRPVQTATPAIVGVSNAASGAPSVAAGSIASIYGSDLAAAAVEASALPLPFALGGTTVSVGGQFAPLFYASPKQVNFLVPRALTGADVVVSRGGNAAAKSALATALYAPGIFITGGVAAALHSDYSLVTLASPAKAGEAILLYFTGRGSINPLLMLPVALPQVRVGNQIATMLWNGPAPGFPGLDQMNFVVPPGTQAGKSPVVVGFLGAASNAADLPVGP